MTRGQLFGELALLYNTPRTATVRAGSAASVWVLTRSVYQGILTGEAMDRTQTTIEQLRVQVPFFSHAPAKQLSQLAYALDHVTIAPGAPLAPTEDALAEGVVYLVDDGSLLGADGSVVVDNVRRPRCLPGLPPQLTGRCLRRCWCPSSSGTRTSGSSSSRS